MLNILIAALLEVKIIPFATDSVFAMLEKAILEAKGVLIN